MVFEKLTLPLAHHSVLASSIPALVHRANNCLSVIDGTIALMQELDPLERVQAQEQCDILKDLLRHLALQARVEQEEVGEIEVCELLSDLEFALGVIGRFQHCEVELRRGVQAAWIQGDRARLYRLLVTLATERFGVLHRGSQPDNSQPDKGTRSLLRIHLSPGERVAHLWLTDTGGRFESDPRLWEAMAAEAEALGESFGFELARRTLGEAHSIRLKLPVARVLEHREPMLRPRSQRILLLQPAGWDAELFVTVLSEKGYRVEHLAALGDAQSAATFDLVLCDEELLASLPSPFPPVLVLGEPTAGQASCGSIEKPIRPKELLAGVGSALARAR